jgi:hypothetical protein
MAYLHPHQQEKIQKWLVSGGQVAAVSGSRRSGLSWCVGSIVSEIILNSPLKLHTIDIQANSNLSWLESEVKRNTKSRKIESGLVDLLNSAGDCIWLIKNLHRADKHFVQDALRAISKCRNSHLIGSPPSFLIEGALNFETAFSKAGDAISPLISHVDPITPWRTIVEVENLIAKISSSPYPRSLVVWLADVTKGDTGFCNEFLLRFQDPTPSAEIINLTYQAIVKNGATANEIRRCANTCDEQLIARLMRGEVIPGLAPPSAPNDLNDLVLMGLTVYDQLVAGYRLRSPLVSDALRTDEKWRSIHAAKETGVASCSHILWQISVVEILLRSLSSLDGTCEEKISGMSMPTRWKGKAKLVKAALIEYLQSTELDSEVCSKITGDAKGWLSEVLPDSTDAAKESRAVLERSGNWDGKSLLGGLGFSDIANLARALDVVTAEEREELNVVNKRRNDAAHFRTVGYDDAHSLETLVRKILPSVNSRAQTVKEAK